MRLGMVYDIPAEKFVCYCDVQRCSEDGRSSQGEAVIENMLRPLKLCFELFRVRPVGGESGLACICGDCLPVPLFNRGFQSFTI